DPARPATADVAQGDGAYRHEAPYHLFERAAHQRDIALAIERAGQRAEEIRQRLSSIALPWCEHRRSITKSSAIKGHGGHGGHGGNPSSRGHFTATPRVELTRSVGAGGSSPAGTGYSFHSPSAKQGH